MNGADTVVVETFTRSSSALTGEMRFVQHHVAAEERRDGRLGEIVARGSKSAGGDDGAGAFQSVGHRCGDRLGGVAAGRPPLNLDTLGSEHSREMRGVGVDRITEEELVTDGDDFDLHRVSRR